ncbi:formate dehydrogenase (NAD+) [Naganishia albida]|nr:formate dehydrogenase (NAD+) [Naganishia albida]
MKVLLVLYDGGKAAEEEPRLLGTIQNKLGIAKWLEEQGHELVATADKEGEGSEFRKHIVDAEVLITTPFHPGYADESTLATAKNLKLCITAGVGSDHIDLDAANKKNITVAEVSGSNVVSVAEHVIMSILLLVRNYTPAHEQVMNGGWDVAPVARHSFDLENKVVGTVGAGRIGYRVLQRLMPFDCKELLYFDYAPLPEKAAAAIKVRRVESLEDMLSQCDIVTINCPLHEKTKGLFNKEMLSRMKPGAWLVNTARGAICDAQAVADALNSGHLSGYAGDVWFPQPAPADHPWRKMRHPLGGGNGMVPHMSGTKIDAQIRYSEGTKKILENYLTGQPQDPANLIVDKGDYVSRAYGQRESKAAERKEEVRTDGQA